MKHEGFTPGPWRWMQRGDFSILERNEEPSRFPILKIANGGLLPMGPDASLVADAPALLAENDAMKVERADFVHMLDNATNGEIKALRDVDYWKNIALATAEDGGPTVSEGSRYDTILADNERLRALLKRTLREHLDSVPHGPESLCSPLFLQIRDALAATKG